MLGAAMALTAAMGFGAAAVFARIGLQYMRPTTGAFVSLLIGIAITLTLALVFHFDDIFALSGHRLRLVPHNRNAELPAWAASQLHQREQNRACRAPLP